jgi:hypothetical protein
VCNTTSKTCGCAASADCAASANGAACNMASGTCGCVGNGDCSTAAAGRVCEMSLGPPPPGPGPGPITASTCGCATTADCPNGYVCSAGPLSGRCIKGCATNADCAARQFPQSVIAPICDATTGLCGDCKSATDCASSARGPLCEGQGLCGCATAADCANAAAGPVCVHTPGIGSACGCTKTADCPNGKTCDLTNYACN